MLNKHLLHHQNLGEQDLLQDLVSEAIQGHGLEVYYMPKNRNFEENVFGEDTNTEYNQAIPIEVYPKNVENWEGEGDMISMFGMEFRDKITFTISQHRWQQLRTEKLMLEDGQVLQLEGITPNNPNSNDGFHIESGSSEGYELTSRPREGDLIYLQLNDVIFKILNVEKEANFYPLGILPVFDITCEKFDYSSEKIDTDNELVDAIEDDYSLALSNDHVLMEDDSIFVLENNEGTLIHPEERFSEDTNSNTYNDSIDLNFDAPEDFSNETSPTQTPLIDSDDNIIELGEEDANDTNVIDNSETHPFQGGFKL